MKERLKTAALVVLASLALFLGWQTWAYNPTLRELMPADALGIDPTVSGNPRRTELPPAAQPIQLAQFRDGTRTAALWDSAEIARAMPLIRQLLGDALGSAGEAQAAREEDWRGVLAGDGIYLRYTEAIPLSAIGEWNAVTSGIDGDALRIALCVREGALWICYENPDGSRFVCQTAARVELPDLGLETPCFFAFERTDSFGRTNPFELLPQPLPVRPDIAVTVPDNMRETAYPLLRALRIDPEFSSPYVDSDGVVSFVEGRRQCSVSPDGFIEYSDLEGESTDTQQSMTLPEYIEEARVLCAALGGVLGGAQWELRSARITESGAKLRFGVHINGCPVFGRDRAYADITVEAGRVSEAYFRVRRYTPKDTLSEPLPLEMAAAAAPGSRTAYDLSLGYLDGGEEVIRPMWLID